MALPATLVLAAILAIAGCGDDGSSNGDDSGVQPADASDRPDAIPCTSDLSPTDDGSGIAADLVLSEIDPGNFIELYNSTSAPISLANVAHQLCSPFAYRALSQSAPEVTVAPGGFAQIPWPTNFTLDGDDAGEVMLYRTANFNVDSDIIDYVCWGPARSPGRKSQAEAAGKWVSDCADALPTGGSIERLASTDGADKDAYQGAATPTPTTCE